MILEEVANLIVTGATGFRLPTSTGSAIPVWLGQIGVDSPGTAVALYETGGVSPVRKFSGVDHERPNIQILVRSTSWTTARTTADRIWRLLEGTHSTALAKTPGSTATTRYLDITPLQSPFDVGTDPKRRHLVSMNFSVWKELS